MSQINMSYCTTLFFIQTLNMQQITILLPVKNGEKYIADAIESILAQTFNDFELLIFDDDSKDRTLKITRGFKDKRMKIFQSRNGYINNLNKGIEIAQGAYIARMDADDMMHPDRLMTQIEIMEKNPSIAVCGSWIKVFGEHINPYILTQDVAGRLENLLDKLKIANFISHPSVMIRRDFLMTHKLSYQHYPYVEDYKLWVEIAKKKGSFYIVPKPLLAYRLSQDQVTITHSQEMIYNAALLRKEIQEYLQKNI